MARVKDMIEDVKHMLSYNTYSYREVADMFGMTVEQVEMLDDSIDDEFSEGV